VLIQKTGTCRQSDIRAVVAAHAVNSNSDHE